ncbi:hypothetical protein BJ875DRAFT_144056 [Amylocarpus encephaloides]|uniref:Uncharacterized protein n=1 Tax=Amylocarpus encephaloides TaxID=45428 RepID=A0A9P8C1S2_9HELO|nr:hypothetical protein BJ875DRAFT_144056 [Amylocarpus encephaloides]
MPPSLPRVAIGGFLRPKPSNATVNPRSFSTTTSLSAIGPENPRFIEIPTSLQPQAFPKRDIKGVLPVPRELFSKRAGDKLAPEYFAATIKKPREQVAPANDYVAWKRNLASGRRRNLRESLDALHARKLRSDRIIAKISARKNEDRELRVNAPKRRDEVLTSATITSAMKQLYVGGIPDPRRKARVQRSKLRVKAKAAAREEDRKNALHTLYMHARSFITTDDQLNAKVEEIFVPKPWRFSMANNVWDAEGAPPSVQDMLSNKARRATAVEGHAGPVQVAGKRLKKIAEELTGGKMD